MTQERFLTPSASKLTLTQRQAREEVVWPRGDWGKEARTLKRTLRFVPLALAQAERLHNLYCATPGYFRLLGGYTPTLGEVRRDIETAQHDPSRHLELLYAPDGMLVGSVDYKTDYPAPGDLTINLLLIREDQQGQGWGRHAVKALEERYASGTLGQPGRRLLASVLGENERGARFWERQGYHFALDARPALTWYAKDLDLARHPAPKSRPQAVAPASALAAHF